MQPEPFPNHKITEIRGESKSGSPFFRSLLEGGALVFFALLVVCEALAHLSDDKKTERRFDKIGIVFFAVAVLAEIVAYPYGQRNDTLSEQIIGSLGAKAQSALRKSDLAEDRAEDAETKANKAEEKSGKALTRAGNAEKSLGRAESEANDALVAAGNAERYISDADKQLVDFQARIAWRTVSDDQEKTLRDELKPFKGRTIDLAWDGVDSEQNTFGPQLAKALHDAELTVQTNGFAINVLPPPEMAVTGILIESDDAEFSEGMARALVLAGLAKRPVAVFPLHVADASMQIRIRPKGP